MAGKLFIVGTPIGNLEDITFRAMKTLQEVDLILCEDTRVTRKLLDHYKITKPTLSYHTHSDIAKIDRVISLLEEGKNLALVSDAGTPGVSDPGSFLVSKVREALPEVEIVAVPGPSALAAAVSLAGISETDFTFLGFLPHKKGRETLFKEITISERAMIFYESPHRILKTLESLEKHSPLKKVIIARELTKVFEQVISGTATELIKYFEANPDKVRGEFVVIVN